MKKQDLNICDICDKEITPPQTRNCKSCEAVICEECFNEKLEICKSCYDERFCVKCGKTSDLVDSEDMCYSCAAERGRI